MTRLTSDTALREIFHMYMRPKRSTIIMDTVNVTITAILKLNPRRTKVTTKMAAERTKKTLSETSKQGPRMFFDLNKKAQHVKITTTANSLLLVLFSAPRGFSLGTPVFPSPQKPTFPNSNSSLESVPN